MSKNYTVSFAQNREDIILEGFFADRKGKPGFYVDVGAGSPLIDSVTRSFYEKGWRGINIEPIDHIYKALLRHRKKDINLNIGVSNRNGTLKFREYDADGFSTFSTEMQEQYLKHPDEFTKGHRDYEVKIKTLSDVLTEQKITEIQFLKIDVEGYEYEVIEGNSWDKFRPEVVCIEANHITKNWGHILIKNDYSMAYFDGLNEYYVDKRRSKPPVFSYVDDMINREPIIRYDAYQYILDTEQQLKQSNQRQAELEQHIKYLDEELKRAHARIDELKKISKYLRMHVGRVVRVAEKKLNARKTRD